MLSTGKAPKGTGPDATRPIPACPHGGKGTGRVSKPDRLLHGASSNESVSGGGRGGTGQESELLCDAQGIPFRLELSGDTLRPEILEDGTGGAGSI